MAKIGSEASFEDLIKLCEEQGWEKTIKILEAITLQTENLQAALFAGTPQQIKTAQKLSTVIIQQNFTIARLKEYYLKNHANTKN